MFRRSLGSLFLFVLFSSWAHSAQRTFVSAGSGSDANLCTRQAPCRNFAAAIAQTDAGGEVVALDSGGYGVVTINGPVSLIAPSGVHAAITAFSSSAVEIYAGASDVVVLRGLYLNGVGGSYGIRFESGKTLHVEGCVISGFSSYGLYGNAPDADVRVIDTMSRDNVSHGFYFRVFSGSIRASLDNIRAVENAAGVNAGQNSIVTVNRSLAAGNSAAGFTSEQPSGTIALESCTTTQNGWGVYAAGIARVSRTLITGNTSGLSIGVGGSMISFGNNSLGGNTNNGTFTSTPGQQ